MKRILNYLPFILYTIGFASFILPVVYIKDEFGTIYYNTLELMFGSGAQELSIGLLLVLILFIITIVFSIIITKKTSKFREFMTYIPGLACGVLLFFSRMLANPNVTNFNIHIGLFLPGFFIISGTVLLFISKVISNEGNKQSE